MNLKVDINEWETFPISGLPKYSPVQQNSMKISFDNQSFIDYKLFQSDVIKGKFYNFIDILTIKIFL